MEIDPTEVLYLQESSNYAHAKEILKPMQFRPATA